MGKRWKDMSLLEKRECRQRTKAMLLAERKRILGSVMDVISPLETILIDKRGVNALCGESYSPPRINGRWRKDKKFPQPVRTEPKAVWRLVDILIYCRDVLGLDYGLLPISEAAE